MVVRFQKFKLQINQYKEANKYQALTKNVMNFVTKCFSDCLGHIFAKSLNCSLTASAEFKPKNLRLSQTTSHCVRLNWDNPYTGVIANYQV